MGLRHPCAHRTASARSAVEPHRRSALNRNFAIPTGVPIRETMRRPQKLLHPFLLVFAYAAISAVMGIVLAEAGSAPSKAGTHGPKRSMAPQHHERQPRL